MIGVNNIYNSLIQGAQTQMSIQDVRNREISSNRSVGTMGEDPQAYNISLNFRHALKVAQDNTLAAKEAESRIKSGSAALTQMMTIMQRVSAIGVGLPPAASQGDLQGAKSELEILRTNLLKLANTQWHGEYVFAGTAVDKAPFSEVVATAAADPLNAAVSRSVVTVPYAGNTVDREAVLSSSQSMKTNVRGDAQAFVDMFASIEAMVRGLDLKIAGDDANGATVLAAAGDAATTANSEISSLNSNLSGKLRAASAQLQIFQEAETGTKNAMESHEAADIASANAALQQSASNLQVIYSLVGRLEQLNLINYI